MIESSPGVQAGFGNRVAERGGRGAGQVDAALDLRTIEIAAVSADELQHVVVAAVDAGSGRRSRRRCRRSRPSRRRPGGSVPLLLLSTLPCRSCRHKCRLRLPTPPLSVSLPSSPFRVSAPSPPLMTSLPPAPLSVSLPPRPLMRLAAAVAGEWCWRRWSPLIGAGSGAVARMKSVASIGGGRYAVDLDGADRAPARVADGDQGVGAAPAQCRCTRVAKFAGGDTRGR